MRDFNREFKLLQNVYTLDVRIHHRICDAQKHLLHTFVKVKLEIIDNWAINVIIK